MAHTVELLLGVVLLVFGFLIFIYALPTLNSATQTGVGTAFENNTGTFKSAINLVNQGLILFPFIFFFGGLALIIKGVGDK